jgi:hypothetical protein
MIRCARFLSVFAIMSASSGVAVHAQGATPRLAVIPRVAQVDDSINIRLRDVQPGTEVTIRAELPNPFGSPFRSQATFRADGRGEVDAATLAPLTGRYRGADPMGLVWSATGEGGIDGLIASESIGVFHPDTLRFTASVDGRKIASARVVSQILTSTIHHTSLRAHGLYGEFFGPATKGPAPGILVFGGSEGGLQAYVQREAELLAAHGYASLALAYFREPGLPTQLVRIPLEYFGRALDWLAARHGVDRNRLAVMGTSRGGELSLLLASLYPQLKAAISYSGSGRIYDTPYQRGVPAWMWRGKPASGAKVAHSISRGAIYVERIRALPRGRAPDRAAVSARYGDDPVPVWRQSSRSREGRCRFLEAYFADARTALPHAEMR